MTANKSEKKISAVLYFYLLLSAQAIDLHEVVLFICAPPTNKLLGAFNRQLNLAAVFRLQILNEDATN